jgi:hypothetical protein
VARDDVLHGLLVPLLAEVCVVLCLGNFPPASNLSVDFLLESSIIGCHFPLPAVREARKVAGVGLWEWRGKLEGSLFCSSKQLLLLLEQSCVHVADCDGVVLCKCRRTLPEEEDCLYSSSFDHLLPVSMKAASRCV